jgi:hypothetical protein
MRPHMMMTIMGIPSIVAFEVEVVELNFKIWEEARLEEVWQT